MHTVHTKAYLPDEDGMWEASRYHKELPDFAPVQVGPLEIGFLICTEIWVMEEAREYAQERCSG